MVANKLSSKTGVYIFDKIADSPAYNNEIRIGDIIVEFNDKRVSSVDDLHKLLDEKVIGVKSEISVLRGGRKTTIQVIPGELI